MPDAQPKHETSITGGVDYDGPWGSWVCTCGAERLHMGSLADASHNASLHRREMTARPKPTASAVLRKHRWMEMDEDCLCGWGGTEDDHEDHQADMLSAAGLLATAEHSCWETVLAEGQPRLQSMVEHDAQVAAQALRDLVADRADIETALSKIEWSEVSVVDLIVHHVTAEANRIVTNAKENN